MTKFFAAVFICLSLGFHVSGQAIITDSSGLKYKILKPGKGRQVTTSDWITFHMHTTNEQDSVLYSTFLITPISIRMTPPQFPGDLVTGLLKLKEGDSAILYLNANQLYNNRPPSYIRSGSDIRVTILVVKLESQEERAASIAAEKEARLKQEIAVIEDYLSVNKLVARRTPAGVFYIVQAPGEGELVKVGNSVSVNYTGKLLNGHIFDSSVGSGPYTFRVGAGEVIKGWDEGIPMFRDGGRGIIIIPSSLAYGTRAQPGIPANSILIFEVEIMGVQ